MTGTKRFEKQKVLRILPKHAWENADDVSERGLKRNLCELGHESEGKACFGCESPCGFGQRMIGTRHRVGKKSQAAVKNSKGL